MSFSAHWCSELQIRQFEERDTAVVIQLANEHAFFDGPVHEEDLKVTNAFPEGFLVAQQDDEVIGFVYGYFRDVPTEVLANWGVSKVATIELLVVSPEYRNKGVGTALLEHLLARLRQAGTDLIGLHCPVQAVEAKQLYERFGFEVSALHMRKRLD
ncbi:MAG: GNAT family N-acetyltransferase [Candidatus Sifarchaeia archaeon]